MAGPNRLQSGDTLNYVALVVLVFRLSHSGVAVSALVVTEIVPTLLLGPVTGVLIDRFDRKHLLIAVDLARAGLVLTVAVTHALWAVYALAALLGVGSTLFNPALQAAIPVLLDDKERLAANSLAWSTGHPVRLWLEHLHRSGMVAARFNARSSPRTRSPTSTVRLSGLWPGVCSTCR